MSEIAKPENQIFFTEQELALRQRRSIKTLQADRLKGGGVPYLKFGRAVRYRMTDVVMWEAACLRVSTSDHGRAREISDAK